MTHHKTATKRSQQHSKWPVRDWVVSHVMLDLALESIWGKIKINRDYDIPYLAGYSQDGKTIYIDRHLPTSFVLKDRVIKTDRYLILHEAVEKTLIDELGLHYQFAHQIALRAEQAAVRADKVSWKAYDWNMQAYIKEAGDERLEKVPADLDLKPYQDEHDKILLKRIKESISQSHSTRSPGSFVAD